MEKLREYQGTVGLFHQVRDNLKDKFSNWRESLPVLSRQRQPPKEAGEEYSHIFRKKTRLELILISAAVMGIEFSYAAETAFVSPTLLEIGVDHARMTMVWALSPLVGFFLTPILGSLSDRCSLPIGRRRPFILILSAGVFLGLMLVPNGKLIGEKFGDNQTHPWGVFFTVVGTALLDFNADACQSPARAYLLDVTIPEDHARGLSTFTVMAGLGGFMGYTMGGINWDITWIGIALGGHVKAVFTIITIIFLLCITCTVSSFKEMPLNEVNKEGSIPMQIKISTDLEEVTENRKLKEEKVSYGSVLDASAEEIKKQQSTTINRIEAGTSTDGHFKPNEELQVEVVSPTLKEYLISIVYMPASLKILCLTNLFSWMAHVCYSLYFTDYVGEAVFGGDPKAEEGSLEHDLYKDGVRFGCYGMAMYSLSCSCYSMLIEKLIKKYRARNVYVGGLLFFGFGMLLMAASKSKFGVICFSWAAGVMYSTLFTMPYLLVAHYHSTNVFNQGNVMGARGLGTDIAIVSSMVFLAQFCLSICMGSLISYAQTTTVVVVVSGCLSICGSIAASQVLYLDL